MINFQYKILRRFNIKGSLSLKKYCEVYGNIVKLSEDPQIKELKVPFEETSVIYYGEEETLESLIPKMKASNEKIQKVDFYQFNSDTKIEESENIKKMATNPFEIRINNHYSISYFPSLNRYIESNIDSLRNLNIQNRNSFNFVLKNILLSNQNKDDLKREIREKVDELIKIYEKYEDELNKKDKIMKERYNKSQKKFVRLSILYFIAHLITFYLLIYHFFGWDEIEPVTYIVGNVYWIIGLAFFIKYKKKLDVPYFFSKSFSDACYNKYCQRLGFNYQGYYFTQRYLRNLRTFNHVIDKI